MIAAVEGDGAGVLLNGAVTRWTPIFFGRPGEIQEVEADRTTGGSATDIVYALLYDGRVFTNPSAAYSPSWSPSAWAPSTGGTTLVGEYGTTLLGHSTGTYLGTASWGALSHDRRWHELDAPGHAERRKPDRLHRRPRRPHDRSEPLGSWSTSQARPNSYLSPTRVQV